MVAPPRDFLTTILERAEGAWPGVNVALDRFAASVGAREIGDEDLVAHGPDLVLAFACLEGHPRALLHFEETILRPARAAVGRVHAEDDFIDDVLQDLRTKLLVGEGKALAGYAGRGPLAGWVRVAATRAAIDARRAAGHVPEQRTVEEIWDQAQLSPELRLLGEAQRRSFQEALRAALANLPAESRNLLRRHLVDGMTLEEIAAPYGVHPATIARRLGALRDEIARAVRAHVADVLGSPATEDLESVFRAIRSQVYVTLSPLVEGGGRPRPLPPQD